MNCLALLLAVSTFCNPISLPEVPVGYICRDLPNGSPLPTDTNSWRYVFWKRGAACQFDETHQFRETAEPGVFALSRFSGSSSTPHRDFGFAQQPQ